MSFKMEIDKMEIEFTDELIQEVIHDMIGWFAIHLTEEQIKTLFVFDQKTAEKIHYWGFDTDERGYMINTITSYLGMENQWPCNGDSRETQRAFYQEFKEKLSTSNIKYTGEYLT